LVESISDLCTSLQSGSWLEVGLATAGVALDGVATASDPLGSLLAAGIGWIIDHLEPLKGWLNDLTGDPGAVLGYAGTWENVGKAMESSGDEFWRIVQADMEGMSGQAVTAYMTYAQGLAEEARAAGGAASAVASALKTCAMVVQVVHDLVRDVLAELAGSILSWVAEFVFTLGLATPLIIEQVTTRVSSLAARIGKSVTSVVKSAKSLKSLLVSLKDALARLAKKIHTKAPGSSRGAGPIRRPLTSAKRNDDIKKWLPGVNPKYNGKPTSPYSNNCGKCSEAVFNNLDRNPKYTGKVNKAQKGTYETPEMEHRTGLPQHPMGNPNDPGSTAYSDIERTLIDGGAGSHAVVGIDRASGPGHWFNAHYDGTNVHVIDGQDGTISHWPPMDPDVNNCDVAIQRADGIPFP
jgi:Papain fold toxin 1, glutamine deamidase